MFGSRAATTTRSNSIADGESENRNVEFALPSPDRAMEHPQDIELDSETVPAKRAAAKRSALVERGGQYWIDGRAGGCRRPRRIPGADRGCHSLPLRSHRGFFDPIRKPP